MELAVAGKGYTPGNKFTMKCLKHHQVVVSIIDVWGQIILCRGAVLDRVGQLAAPLISIYWQASGNTPIVTTTDVSWEAKQPPQLQWLRATEFDNEAGRRDGI